MTSVVMTHAVGDMDTWLAGGPNRKPAFDQFCDSYRLFRHTEGNRVSIVCDGVDLEKMKEVLSSEMAAKAKEADTVLDPIDAFILIEGGQ